MRSYCRLPLGEVSKGLMMAPPAGDLMRSRSPGQVCSSQVEGERGAGVNRWKPCRLLFCPPVRFLMCCRQRLALGKECTKQIPEDGSHGEDYEA